MSKHTPGPWKRKIKSVLIPIAPYEWAEAYGGSIANARLIAAAPDLLEALKEIVAAADGKGWEQLDPSFKKARAAIAKAEGEES